MGPRFQAISLTALAGVLVSDRVAAALALYPSRLVMASVRSVQATGRLGNLERVDSTRVGLAAGAATLWSKNV
jgi:hypothetical protein